MTLREPQCTKTKKDHGGGWVHFESLSVRKNREPQCTIITNQNKPLHVG